MDTTDTTDAFGGENQTSDASYTAGAESTNTSCVVFEMHDFLFDVVHSVRDSSADNLVRTVTPYGVLGISLLLCFCGFYALRLVMGVVAFSTGVVGTLQLLALSKVGDEVPCDVASVLVLIGGGLSTLIAIFMTRMLSALLGSLGACVAVGAVFAACGDVCNAALWIDAPSFLGWTLVPFWASMLVAAVVGGVVARRRHRELLATVAAILGGFGVTVSLRSILSEQGQEMPGWVVLATVGVSASIGLGTQYWIVQHRRRRRRRRAALTNQVPRGT